MATRSSKPQDQTQRASGDSATCRDFQLLSSLEAVWRRLQVSHRGAYTARRARALERYCRSASVIRVLLVCLLTLLPILGFVILMELVPLDPPAAGWQANPGWFIRYVFVFTILAMSCVEQAASFLPSIEISPSQVVGITLASVAGYFAVLVPLAELWVFPIPFVFGLTGGVFTGFFLVAFVLSLGREAWGQSEQFSAQARFLKDVSSVEGAMCFIYPIFNAVFRTLKGFQQLAFMGVLFLLKVAMRLAMASACTRHEIQDSDDPWRARLPELVVFTTELFHVLYLTTCLEGQEVSIWTTLALVTIDVINSVVSVRHLLKRVAAVPLISPKPTHVNAGVRVTRSMPAVKVSPLSPPAVGPRTTSLQAKTRSMTLKLARRSSTRKFIRVVPLGQTAHLVSQQVDLEPESAAQTMRLQTLSMMEYFILVEYVECIIPAMYGIYTAVLVHLPNSAYYPTLVDATELELRASQTNVAFYVLLEVATLLFFAMQLRRHVHFSVLYQLAFVLETAALDVQAKLAMFIPYCFFFFLQHNGAW